MQSSPNGLDFAKLCHNYETVPLPQINGWRHTSLYRTIIQYVKIDLDNEIHDAGKYIQN